MSLFTRLAKALLAYAVHEHQEGHARRIDVWLQPRSLIVQDDGRGMGLDRDGYVESLMGLLVGRADAVQLHGVGLSLIATSTPSLRIESRRKGERWAQHFHWGVPDGAPSRLGADADTGTRIAMDVAPDEADIDTSALRAEVARWCLAHPGLTIEVH